MPSPTFVKIHEKEDSSGAKFQTKGAPLPHTHEARVTEQ